MAAGRKGEYRQRRCLSNLFQQIHGASTRCTGTVREWVEDCCSHGYRRKPTDGTAEQYSDDCSRVKRGGAWHSFPGSLRSAFRTSNPPRGGRSRRGDDTGRYSSTGFRVARALATPPMIVQPAVAVLASPIAVNPLSPERARALKPKDSFKECEKRPEMVVVPAGSFTMGSPASEKERSSDEEPQRRVTFSQQFAVGRFAVTFDEWDACVADGGCNAYLPDDHGWGRGRRPAINVNWDDAKTYVAWLSRKTGNAYRLLSQAEREYVTRAGTTTPFWWGSAISTAQANYDGSKTYGSGSKGEHPEKTVPVDSFRPNPWGLYQVHGNVREWVEDCNKYTYVGAPTDGSAWTSGDCRRRAVRGGSWAGKPQDLRSASGVGRPPHTRYLDDVGFRIAQTLIVLIAPPATPATPAQPAVGVFRVISLSPEQERCLQPKQTFKECDAARRWWWCRRDRSPWARLWTRRNARPTKDHSVAYPLGGRLRSAGSR